MILPGDARAVLPTIKASSIQTCVCSPPYYGLRDYGTAKWEGGDSSCDHRRRTSRAPHERKASTLGGGTDTVRVQEEADVYRERCEKCGAERRDKQIGLEASPEEYIAVLVEVFREVRRVLHPSGTLWLNLGDSYAGSGKGRNSDGVSQWCGGKQETNVGSTMGRLPTGWVGGACKPKDLMGIPWRVALALQADGWYLRSDIIWAKGVSFCDTYNGSVMPESVTDRPTTSHEHLFLLSKEPHYYYDADAVREKDAGVMPYGGSTIPKRLDERGAGKHGKTSMVRGMSREEKMKYYGNGRNLRTVWTINPQGFKEAHFATYPMRLVEPCVKAGTSEKGACVDCGAPWERVVERTRYKVGESKRWEGCSLRNDAGDGRYAHVTSTTGWAPSCQCGQETRRPCVVLDPFAGSGTTGIVAQRLAREFLGIELNPEYVTLARDGVDGPLFRQEEDTWLVDG